MKTVLSFTIFLVLELNLVYSQVSINSDGTLPDSSSMLEVKSSVSGFLIPRMTFTKRDSIINPAEGLMVYCTDCGTNGSVSIYLKGNWRNFMPCYLATPLPDSNVYSPGQIEWSWKSVSGASGYKWNTTNNLGTATDLGTSITKTETGIGCGSVYSRFVWAYKDCGTSEACSLSATIPSSVPGTPGTGIHNSTSNQITWNWSSVSGADAYRWNTINNAATSTDIGSDTTKTESGLYCNQSHTRYLWAFNACGYSDVVILTDSTSACVCGDSMQIVHIADTVAPVNKTTVYGTVNNIPGEVTKCWITSNLGSDHQASAVNDASEASAGWYWQFNRKQGFKHDGVTRTPNTTWIGSISENSDWQVENDPCGIELGNGWRIPTNSEWNNVDIGGSWADWSGPWNSGLKLHAAGSLGYNGNPLERGTTGKYPSSTQHSDIINYYLYFTSYLSSGNVQTGKQYGSPLRCVK